jgi:hypothetical protein
MLGMVVPYELEPLHVTQEPTPASEVWFVEDGDEIPANPLPAYLAPELGPSSLLDVGSAVQ